MMCNSSAISEMKFWILESVG